MKNFFSFQSIKENRVFFILFSVIILLGLGISTTPGFPKCNFFNLNALIIAISVWIISSVVDYKNIST
jgi:type III secretory pathway component EscV